MIASRSFGLAIDSLVTSVDVETDSGLVSSLKSSLFIGDCSAGFGSSGAVESISHFPLKGTTSMIICFAHALSNVDFTEIVEYGSMRYDQSFSSTPLTVIFPFLGSDILIFTSNTSVISLETTGLPVTSLISLRALFRVFDLDSANAFLVTTAGLSIVRVLYCTFS